MVDLLFQFYLTNYGVSKTKYNELSEKLYAAVGQHYYGTITGLEPDEFLQTFNNYKKGLPTKKYTYEETIANLNAFLNKKYCNAFSNYKKRTITP